LKYNFFLLLIAATLLPGGAESACGMVVGGANQDNLLILYRKDTINKSYFALIAPFAGEMGF
jgi:hypothetical protein